MHILLDKISAMIITMTIFLMVFSVNTRNGKSMTETTAFYSLTTQTENLAKILRRDLQGIEELLTVTEIAWGDGSTEFHFESRVGEDSTKRTIIYRKVPASTHNGVQFYTLDRLVDDVPDGGSTDIITAWEIRALNEDAGIITDPDDAQQIYVRFEAASPIIETETVESIQWESRFFPPLRNK